jgi:hypothetical protein
MRIVVRICVRRLVAFLLGVPVANDNTLTVSSLPALNAESIYNHVVENCVTLVSRWRCRKVHFRLDASLAL